MLLTLVLLLASFASAQLTWDVPASVEKNKNFEVILEGSEFYAVELDIPSGINVVSDPSNGVLSNDVYHLAYAGTLPLSLRSGFTGEFTLRGEYAQGDGVKDLPNKKVLVVESTSSASCPACPDDSDWSACEDGTQTRNIYECSEDTGFVCEQAKNSRECSSDFGVQSDDGEETEETKTIWQRIKDSFSRFWDFITFSN